MTKEPKEPKESISPFEFVAAIVRRRKDLLRERPDGEKEYQGHRFLITRALSFYPDTVKLAQMVNERPDISARMHHDFLINTVRAQPSRSASKWPKMEKDDAVATVAQYYGCSMRAASPMVSLHTEEQLDVMRQDLDRGGRGKR